jgi:hypothetical protein
MRSAHSIVAGSSGGRCASGRGPPLASPARDIALALFGMDDRHREVQTFLAGDLAYQIDDELEVRLAAGAATGANQHRNPLRDRRPQH